MAGSGCDSQQTGRRAAPHLAAAHARAFALLLVAGRCAAQQAGEITVEEPPPMAYKTCTAAGGCITEPSAVTLDANWRWVHAVGGYNNCNTGGQWDSQLCPDGLSCATNCSVEGVDAQGYRHSYGVHPADGGVELKFVSEGGNVGSRVYLSDGNSSYKLLKLKNREFTFEVDVSTLACGLNGAMYLVEMEEDGGLGRGGNQAGAKFGTGYCDAQCPKDVKWQHGEANVHGGHGMCCFEMDLWEANAQATAFTSHPCNVDGPYRCEGVSCGDGSLGERYQGVCDKDGCDWNAWRNGEHGSALYGLGPGFQVDTSRPVTVVTQFVTEDGTDAGKLSDIRRFYVQDGKVVANEDSKVAGTSGNSMTDEYCGLQKAAFHDADDHKAKGGLARMGEALERGLVLALSVWDDGATHMGWLDGASYPEGVSGPGSSRGPCDGSTSGPGHLRSHHADASVKYMNLRHGEIGSTTEGQVPPGARRLDPVLV